MGGGWLRAMAPALSMAVGAAITTPGTATAAPQAALPPTQAGPAETPLKLLQAHVFFRHGDRAPVPFRGVDVAEQGAALWAARVQKPPPHIAAHNHSRGTEVPFGALTQKGAAQASALGVQLRVLYGTLLEEALGKESSPAALAVRSTDYPRTHLSAHYVLSGLLGSEEAAAQVPIHIRPPAEENLYSNERCARLQALWTQRWRRVIRGQGMAEQEARDWQLRLANLKEALAKKFQLGPGRRFPWVAAMDQLYTAQAHGDPFPEGVSAEDLEAVRLYLGLAVAQAYRNQELCQLAMGRLLSEVVGAMADCCSASGMAAPHLLLYSGHDVTLQPLAACLGIPLGTWPDYSAFLAFELWATPDQQHHFVRVLYNGQEVHLPIAPPQDKDTWPTKRFELKQAGAFSTWDDFKKLTGWSRISAEDYERRCLEPS